jgi:hypothetical protein
MTKQRTPEQLADEARGLLDEQDAISPRERFEALFSDYKEPTDTGEIPASARREIEAMSKIVEVLAPLSARKRLAVLRCVQEIDQARRDERQFAMDRAAVVEVERQLAATEGPTDE